MTDQLQEIIRPQPGPQTAFLSTPADIAIYGGSAGGGKTYALLMEPLRHIYRKDFGAVAFRRTRPRIIAEGGLWDEGMKMYPPLGAEPQVGYTRFKFPTGSRISFKSMQYDSDTLQYQGAQIPLILFDQVEEFTRKQFWFMFSRNRSTIGMNSYVRATCNPDPDSFVADLISWYIAEDGYADLSRAGKIRWFVRDGADIHWGDSKQELLDRDPESLPKSFTFIPASIFIILF